MDRLLRIVHTLAMGLWFGAMTFFLFGTALPIIAGMQALTMNEQSWLRKEMKESGLQDKDLEAKHRKDQGTRLAGDALEPLFARYFPLQVVCGAVALAGALVWFKYPGKIHQVRVLVILVAWLLALTNLLWLAPKVHQLRMDRYSPLSHVVDSAQASFETWHNLSLFTDLATWLLVMIGLALAPFLPPARRDV